MEVNILTVYILFAILIKIIYIILVILVIYFTYKKNNELIEKFTFWKDHAEFLFTVLMAFFLVIIFNPFIEGLKLINKKAKILLFTFGIIILINAEWGKFIEESIISKLIKK
jgi:hypothetical protein